MWTPTHIAVTVSRARNLLDKGKGGNDAYCLIGMGKEKFLTSVRTKTTSPIWDEQAEFELTERADLKLTVYHKSSIIDEFIGRVVINLSDLFNENNKSFTKWYKLQPKADKVEKQPKERGEIEVKVDFIIKPKTGSVMDLSSFSNQKEKTLSLKNLKDRSSSIKSSLGDKFKILNKPRKSKYNGENQLAEQARRMDGSKLDFLDGEDIGSLTSSYSSLNGPKLSNESKQMSRFNPSRSSFMSGTSSRIDHDSSSINDNSTHNEDEFNEENEEMSMNDEFSSSFNRNNSFRRSSLRRHSKKLQPNKLLHNISSNNSNDHSNESENSTESSKIHIAPLPPFFGQNSNDQPTTQQRYDILSSIILEENSPSVNNNTDFNNEEQSINSSLNVNQSTKAELESSFANIFTSSFASSSDKTNDMSNNKNENLVNKTPEIETPFIDTNLLHPKRNNFSFELSPKLSNKDVSFNSSMATITKSETSFANKKIEKNTANEEDDDQIDWASSDDDEIVKQEIETFEKNQENIKNNKAQTNKNNKTHNKPSIDSSIDNQLTNEQLDKFVKKNQELKTSNIPNSTSFSIDIDPFSSSSESNSSHSSPKPSKTNQIKVESSNIENIETIENNPFFSTNPFHTNFNSTNPFLDPFLSFDNFDKKMSDENNQFEKNTPFNSENDAINSEPVNNKQVKFDSFFTDLNNQQDENYINSNENNNDLNQTNIEEKEEINQIENDLEVLKEEKEEEEKNEKENHIDSDSSDDYSIPPPMPKTQRLSVVNFNVNLNVNDESKNDNQNKLNQDQNENDIDFDDMDKAFDNYSSNLTDFSKENTKKQSNDEISDLAYDLNEASKALNDLKQDQTDINVDEIIIDDDEPHISKDDTKNIKSQLLSNNNDNSSTSNENLFVRNMIFRQSERRKVIPTQDLTSDLNSERDFKTSNNDITQQEKSNRSSMKINLNEQNNRRITHNFDDEIKTPEFDHNYVFQDDSSTKGDSNQTSKVKAQGLPDLINQKEPTDKAKKYLEGIDGVKFNEIDVPDTLKKQLEYFDRDELLQLIAYQKKYLDFKESRIKDLENYIDNLVVKIIEIEPLILMNASCILAKK